MLDDQPRHISTAEQITILHRSVHPNPGRGLVGRALFPSFAAMLLRLTAITALGVALLAVFTK
jgi:hypothetical protein